ncbi:MAG: septation ring formation regulator EzrA [Bacilli bacterium]
MDSLILFFTTLFVLIILIIITIVIYINKKTSKYKDILSDIETMTNELINSELLKEFERAKASMEDKNIEMQVNHYKKEVDDIKNEKIAYLTDMILESDLLLEQKKFKELNTKIIALEIEAYELKNYSFSILERLKEITTSEEKNRAIITEVKTVYRQLNAYFDQNKENYGELTKTIELQFENIQKRFIDFEHNMTQKNYDDVVNIVHSVENMVKHMKVVLEEVPSVLALANNVIPKKVLELKRVYNLMEKEGFVLDYINLESNLEETSKKISNIFDRAKKLNLEDSLIELRTISDYFDAIFIKLEKEKVAKSDFLSNKSTLIGKVNKINHVMDQIYFHLDEGITDYDISEVNLEDIEVLKTDLIKINEKAREIVDELKPKSFAYSKLNKEIELLIMEINKKEIKLNNIFNVIGTLKNNESRAHEQLNEIVKIITEAKYKTREYKFPTLTNDYFVHLEDAEEALKEVVKELDNKPINISALNMRVDTARDLAFKLFNTIDEIIKTSKLLEGTITYANRYVGRYNEVELAIKKVTSHYNTGNYKKGLELIIHVLDNIEPDIYSKLYLLYIEQNT